MPVKNSKIIEKKNSAKKSEKENIREKIDSKTKKSGPAFSVLKLPSASENAAEKDFENDNLAKNASKTQKNSKKSAKNKNLPREIAQNQFLALHDKLNASFDKSEFISKIKKDADDGDCVAQDFMAYLYKSGYGRIIPENFSKQLRYEILSGAGGNEFAINKLQFYFNYALDQIVYDDQFNLICYKLNVNEYNYLNVFCKFICEALVKKLAIDSKALGEEKDVFAPYRPETFRDFRRAIDEILPNLMEEWKH